MVDALLDFMLGRMRGISQFYFDYQLLFNSIVVGVAAYFLIKSKKKSEQESNN